MRVLRRCLLEVLESRRQQLDRVLAILRDASALSLVPQLPNPRTLVKRSFALLSSIPSLSFLSSLICCRPSATSFRFLIMNRSSQISSSSSKGFFFRSPCPKPSRDAMAVEDRLKRNASVSGARARSSSEVSETRERSSAAVSVSPSARSRKTSRSKT